MPHLQKTVNECSIATLKWVLVLPFGSWPSRCLLAKETT